VFYVTLRIDTYGFYGTYDTLQFPMLREGGQQALRWYSLRLPTEEWPGWVECGRLILRKLPYRWSSIPLLTASKIQ